MVYGPGGYKYIDFLKFGFPMQVILWLFTVAILAVDGTFTNLAIIWLGSVAFLVVAGFGRWRWEIAKLKRDGLWNVS